MGLKTYTLTIIVDTENDKVEYLGEEITEESTDIFYKLEHDPSYWCSDIIYQLRGTDAVGES
jgi:hypothetical protein